MSTELTTETSTYFPCGISTYKIFPDHSRTYLKLIYHGHLEHQHADHRHEAIKCKLLTSYSYKNFPFTLTLCNTCCWLGQPNIGLVCGIGVPRLSERRTFVAGIPSLILNRGHEYLYYCSFCCLCQLSPLSKVQTLSCFECTPYLNPTEDKSSPKNGCCCLAKYYFATLSIWLINKSVLTLLVYWSPPISKHWSFSFHTWNCWR